MCHFKNDFLFYFFHNFFLLHNWNFNNLFFHNSIRNNFFNNFSHIDFSFFSVSNKSRNFSVQIHSLFVGDNVRDLPFNFNVSVSFKDLFIDYLNLFYFLSCLSDIDWLFNDFFDFNVFFRSRYFNRFLNFYNFSFLNNNIFVCLDFYNFLLI